MKQIFIIFFFSILASNILKAQTQGIDQTFRPVIYASLVASQVDGDTYGGYSKPGFMLGAGINRQLSKVFEVEFGLTFIQKGARHNYGLDSASRNNPANPFFLSRLNYLEIPLTVRMNYKKFNAEVGGAAAYLIQNPPYVSTNNPTYIDDKYKNFDFSYIVGLGYKFNPLLSINVRFEYSIITIHPYYTSQVGVYHGQFPYSLFNQGLYNNVLQLCLRYRIPPRVVTATTPPTNGQ
ncbi:MAG TPA: porin family protein [Bacteroidia bacterium]|nr:porin family protein [Bacteroidia bacterium]